MKISLFLVFITFINCSAKLSNIPNDYSVYHYNALKAENHFLYLNIDSAAYIYKQIFDAYDKLFFKELNNALFCFIAINDHSNALKVSKQMVLQGAELNYFTKNEFNSFRKTTQWEDLNNSYPRLRETYLSSFNLSIRDEIYSLLREDQYYTVKFSNSRSTDSIYYVNFKKFLSIESKHGFPDFFRNNDSLEIVQTIFIHYLKLEQRVEGNEILKGKKPYDQMKFDSINFSGRINNWFRSGLIDLNMLETIHSFNNYEGMGSLKGSILFDFDKEEVRVDLTDDAINELNIKRKVLGLPAISADYKRRIEGMWSTFNFKPLKEAYKGCFHIKDHSCFNNLFADFRSRFLKDLFSKNGFEGFIFSNTLMPNVYIRDDLNFRQFLQESNGFNY